MSAGPSKLRLLHPKWLLLHVATVAACITMLGLGRWQWDVAHRHHGDIRYYAYAFQWWAFVGFALLMWYRVILDYLHRRPETGPVAEPRRESRYLAYQPPAAKADPDPERARFNAYLAELSAADPAPADRAPAEPATAPQPAVDLPTHQPEDDRMPRSTRPERQAAE